MAVFCGRDSSDFSLTLTGSLFPSSFTSYFDVGGGSKFNQAEKIPH